MARVRHRGWWIAGAVVTITLLAAGIWAWSIAAVASSGRSAATAALAQAEAGDLDAALASFEQAEADFSRAHDLLGPQWLQSVPLLGRQLVAAENLMTIGREGAAAGTELLEITRLATSLTGGNRLNQLITGAQPRLDAALVSLVRISDCADQLSTDGLVPPLAEAVTEARGVLEPMSLMLDNSQELLDLERYLTAGDHTFLLLAQNSSELRPTGGFVGTYGLLQFGPSGIELKSFSDIYKLPRDTLNLPLPEGRSIAHSHLNFRDANWWLDFPTSAETMLKLWDNMKQPEVDGIIALDVPLLQALLKVHGPISVPESSEKITEENAMLVLNEVVQYELSGTGNRDDRKAAVITLVSKLFGWLSDLPADQVRPALESITRSANEKHLQLYFTDDVAQGAIEQVGWSGSLDPPAGTTDLLAISNGLVNASKANYGVTKTVDYSVAVAPDGSAETTLKLGYSKRDEKLLGVPRHWVANYARVYRRAGTELSDPANGFESINDAVGLPTFGQFVRLNLGQSKELVLQNTLPQAVQQGGPAQAGPDSVTGEADGWHYRLSFAKQADLYETQAAVRVTLPEQWRVISAKAWRRNDGKEIPVTIEGSKLSFDTPLKQDLIFDIELAKA